MEVHLVKKDGHCQGIFSTFELANEYALTLNPSQTWPVYIETQKMNIPFKYQANMDGAWITGKTIDEKRVEEYKKALEMLNRHGGHMMDYVSLKNAFSDVVTWLETSSSTREPVRGTSDSQKFVSG